MKFAQITLTVVSVLALSLSASAIASPPSSQTTDPARPKPFSDRDRHASANGAAIQACYNKGAKAYKDALATGRFTNAQARQLQGAIVSACIKRIPKPQNA